MVEGRNLQGREKLQVHAKPPEAKYGWICRLSWYMICKFRTFSGKEERYFMAGVLFALMVLGYLVFLIDWKELRAVLAQGGWGTAVFFVVVGVLIYSALVTPHVIAASAGHH
jgi:hypothetical protein